MRHPLGQRARASARTAANWLRNRIDAPVLVLVYHRVTTLRRDPQLLAVAPENFRAQLHCLKQAYPLVRFEADWSTVKEPSVAITFDDGYADNALEALPIIEEVGVPATFFVSTGTISTLNEFWWDELERLILDRTGHPAQFVLRDGRHGRSWGTRSEAERETLYRELHPLMKLVDQRHRGEWLQQLRTWAGADERGRENYRPLTREELRQLAASHWVTIGAHTIWHDPLSVLSYQRQEHEIVVSRNDLASWTGKEINVFSYPFGGKDDYNKDSVEICRKAGFVRAAANVAGQAHRWTDQYQIPRCLVRNWAGDQFALRIKRLMLQ